MSDKSKPAEAMVEAVARAMYERSPIIESGENIDGFQISPGGALSWEQVIESGYDEITDDFRESARAAIAAHWSALAPVIAEAWIDGTGWDGQRKLALWGSHAEPYANRILSTLRARTSSPQHEARNEGDVG